ncbi:MAG TPA: class II fructose-bisphosphate aldolase [Clostridia bacterium]
MPKLILCRHGQSEWIGVREVAAAVKAIREETGRPIFLNADHTKSLDHAIEAAKAGFDEVLVDFSHLPFEEDLKQTKDAVSRLREINPELVIEGEIGYIGSSSAILESKPENMFLTTPDEAVRFVAETGINVLAPSVGNMHGLLASMLKGNEFKHLDIPRIHAIKVATNDIYLTLHGGSGTADEDFVSAIKEGVNIVHVNTELRLAWRKGIESALQSNPNEVVPYKLMKPAYDEIKEVVLRRLKLFSGK